jgi:integrase
LNGAEITRESIRAYLENFNGMAPITRANILKAFRRFFRDYLGAGELVATFKLPRSEFRPKMVPTREQLRTFYAALKTPAEQALFLLYATTGLRRSEVASLTIGDIDFERRIILPRTESTATKRRWVSCFNAECERALREYLNGRSALNPDAKIFSGNGDTLTEWFKWASEASGIKITPKMLRDWFACEMGELGVADRYVDAFCGRVPRSVLGEALHGLLARAAEAHIRWRKFAGFILRVRPAPIRKRGRVSFY